eukprot:TRINITY_DN14708_c0_g1_i2.p1 TRINITY_DN14708_c0_g1~~TRINITY_DN14708_c0_g1_i2.p1  ORF type:complete len:739 (-),score=256.53 TRINITY_DN14708_c0_g1_i2:43-2178(-)
MLRPASCASESLENYFEDSEVKKKPIARVIALLNGMSEKLEEEQKEDKERKEKLDCWCKANKVDKEEAIKAGRAKLERLTAYVEELIPKIEQLKAQIRSTTVELNKNNFTLQKANAIREQQVANFKEDEQSLLKSISDVAGARAALSNSTNEQLTETFANSPAATTPTAFVQMSPAEVQLMSSKLTKAMQMHWATQYRHLSRSEKMTLDDFMANPLALQSQLKQLQVGKRTRGRAAFLQTEQEAPSMGSIVGILQTMADDFASDLQKELDEEKENRLHYNELVKAKTAEMKANVQTIAQKTEANSTATTNLAKARKSIKATNTTLLEDIKFQAYVNERCSGNDVKFNERVAARAEELEAISKTVEVLRSDEARDLLPRAVSFLQESSQSPEAKDATRKAGAMLMQVGQKLGNQQLVTLGLTSKIDSFTKVKEEIEKMVADLKKQQTDEVAHRDECIDDLDKNNLTTAEKQRLKGRAEDKIQALETQIKECTQTIEMLTAEVEEMRKQLKVAGETRQKENVAFQTEVEEQRASQSILRKAVKFLQDYYGKGVTAKRTALVQADDDPRESDGTYGGAENFKDYKKSGGGIGVVTLVETIIQDSQKDEAEAVAAEQEAQVTYEGFTKETTENLKAKNAAIEVKTKEKAEAQSDLADERSDREDFISELDALAETKVNLHKECNFFLLNFDVRQKARAQEMQALAEAKGILSGAN